MDVKYLRKTFVVENSTSEKTVQRTESVIKSRESCVSSKVCDNGDFRKKRVTTPYISNERLFMKKHQHLKYKSGSVQKQITPCAFDISDPWTMISKKYLPNVVLGSQWWAKIISNQDMIFQKSIMCQKLCMISKD